MTTTLASISSIAGSALANLDPAPLPPDHTVYIQTVRDWFRLAKTDTTTTADGISIVTASGGTGRWFRKNLADPSWLKQATWVIDPAGNDENSGIDAGHAIKTCAERQRRWGRSALVPQPTTITYLGSPPATDPEIFSRTLIGYNATLTIQGQRTVVATGTLTGFTAKNRNPPTPTPNIIADTGLVGGFAAHVGRLCRITGGGRANVAWVISRDLGGGSAEITTPGTSDTTGFSSFTRATPQIGDPYEIVTLPIVPGGEMTFGIGSDQDPPTGFGRVVMQDTEFAFGSAGTNAFASGIITDFVKLNIARCRFSAMFLRGNTPPVISQSAQLGSVAVVGGAFIAFRAGLCYGHMQVNDSRVQLDYDYLLEGTQCNLVAGRGGFVEIGSACAFRNNGDAVGVNPGGVVAAIQGADPEGSFLWGTANVGRGAATGGNGSIVWWTGTGGHKPTINQGLGLGRELRVNGNDFLWDDAPVISNGSVVGEWNQ